MINEVSAVESKGSYRKDFPSYLADLNRERFTSDKRSKKRSWLDTIFIVMLTLAIGAFYAWSIFGRSLPPQLT